MFKNIIFITVFILIVIANYLIFISSPIDNYLGVSQKIFYFHIASAFSSFIAVFLLLLGSIFFLVTNKDKFDYFANASSRVAFLFCSLVLVSGMIWGKYAWNIWFRWEPRLVSFLFLWLVLLVYSIFRHFSNEANTKTHASIIGILGSITVPITILSIKLLPSSQQLHPQVIENNGLHPSMYPAFIMSLISILLLESILIYLVYQINKLEECYG